MKTENRTHAPKLPLPLPLGKCFLVFGFGLCFVPSLELVLGRKTRTLLSAAAAASPSAAPFLFLFGPRLRLRPRPTWQPLKECGLASSRHTHVGAG